MVGAIHVEAVEVQRGGLVAQVVVGVDDDLITHIGLDGLQKLSVAMPWKAGGVVYWNRPQIVHPYNRTFKCSIGVGSNPADLEVICDGGGGGELWECEQRSRHAGQEGREHGVEVQLNGGGRQGEQSKAEQSKAELRRPHQHRWENGKTKTRWEKAGSDKTERSGMKEAELKDGGEQRASGQGISVDR